MNDNELQFILKMQDQASRTLQAFNSSVRGLSSAIQSQIAAMNQLTGALNNHASASQKFASASTSHAAAHKAAAEGAKEHAAEELSLVVRSKAAIAQGRIVAATISIGAGPVHSTAA